MEQLSLRIFKGINISFLHFLQRIILYELRHNDRKISLEKLT